MFASIVEYRLNPIFKQDFMRYWKEYVDMLAKAKALDKAYLHTETPISLVAYKRWLSRQAFEDFYLQSEGEILLQQYKIEETCNDVKVLHRMEILKESLHES